MRGRRQTQSRKQLLHQNFNPRPHAGATDDQDVFQVYFFISIHAPMRGRPWSITYTGLQVIFQSTPPCGGDLVCIIDDRNFTDFNPRPHAGATIRHDHFRHHGHISIHAPMRGRRCTTGDDSKEVKNFNPRPHAGATTMAGMYRRQVRDFNPRPHAGATVRRGSQIPSDVPVFFSRRSSFHTL